MPGVLSSRSGSFVQGCPGGPAHPGQQSSRVASSRELEISLSICVSSECRSFFVSQPQFRGLHVCCKSEYCPSLNEPPPPFGSLPPIRQSSQPLATRARCMTTLPKSIRYAGQSHSPLPSSFSMFRVLPVDTRTPVPVLSTSHGLFLAVCTQVDIIFPKSCRPLLSLPFRVEKQKQKKLPKTKTGLDLRAARAQLCVMLALGEEVTATNGTSRPLKLYTRCHKCARSSIPVPREAVKTSGSGEPRCRPTITRPGVLSRSRSISVSLISPEQCGQHIQRQAPGGR